LEIPDTGTIAINGQRLLSDSASLQTYRRKNGFLFQQFNLFPHLTARRNISLPLEKVHGHTPAEARTMAEQALDRFSLLDHADKLPAQLSGGQQQRVGIARAVADQVAFVAMGKIAEISPPAELFGAPKSAICQRFLSRVMRY
jgi:ABC-type polar amino acid transport system ATPase subunit